MRVVKTGSRQTSMRALAASMGSFRTKEFAARAENDLNLNFNTARSFVAEMSRLGMIVRKSEVKASRGPNAFVWEWVGDKSRDTLATAYEPPKRHASVWHYAQGISV